MVIVNDQKFACQSCIKGHRSSACNHTDRPLFEIRKKGRPATQCDGCRDLRRTKRLHVKCACEGRKDPESEIGPVQIQPPTNGNRFGRKIPLVPTLPNGIRDIQNNGLNVAKSPILPTSSVPSVVIDKECSVNLNDRPRPARACCSQKITHMPQPISADSTKNAHGAGGDAHGATIQPILESSLGLSILQSNPSAKSHGILHPSLSNTRALHGIDCLCGPGCQCLGCTKHQQIPSEDGDIRMASGDCPSDCPSCVDNSCGGMLPVAQSSHHIPSRSNAAPSSTWFTSPDLSQGFSVDLGYSDEEMDAEGSPDPDFCMLPEASTHCTFNGAVYSQKSLTTSMEPMSINKQAEEVSSGTKRSCCAGKKQPPKFNGKISINGQSSRGLRL